MMYFGTASTERVRDAMRADYLGQIVTPAAGNRYEEWVTFIVDNSIYSDEYPGDLGYLRMLEELSDYRSRCRFAVAPDVVADHQATLERSWPMLRPIREVVGRVALCAQNGATPDDMPWDYIDAVFLAGIVECVPCGLVPDLAELRDLKARGNPCPRCRVRMEEWKVSAMAAAITAEAKRRGKWVHMGRVNSDKRIRRAREMGVDSGDGTYIAKGPDINLIRLLGWLYPDDFRWMRAEQRPTTAQHAQRGLPDDLFSQGQLFDFAAVA
ncbi:hypothetical protein MED01_002316 [Micromonospora sp. MED01]|uniref:hypothetical protein n=1 Tax=Micromonospora alfalfae TaxID=2911212 RepID=UPI001EE8D146|nr:hypothetical protein [Micromonospora alfalfae]MCG5464151.1 hypothetical protein [Micromonospora alfalfae]